MVVFAANPLNPPYQGDLGLRKPALERFKSYSENKKLKGSDADTLIRVNLNKISKSMRVIGITLGVLLLAVIILLWSRKHYLMIENFLEVIKQKAEDIEAVTKFRVIGITLGVLLLAVSFCFGHGDEEVAEDLEAVKSTGYWIYNDLDKGLAEAEKTGQPLLIVFR